MIRLTAAQINPTIGDMVGNVALMLNAARKARDEGARLVVFPELSLTGYWPGDLLEETDFLARVAEGMVLLKQASRETPSVYWLVGAPLPRSGVGKKLYNAMHIVNNGEVLTSCLKQLLPTYGVFDERRHFEPGPETAKVLRLDGVNIGMLVCEDAWNADGHDYLVNPFERMADASPDLIIAANASPSHLGKHEQRLGLFASACKKYRVPLLYVNQTGGNDELVFDGASFAMDASGTLAYEAERFAEHIYTIGFEPELGRFVSARDGSSLPAVVRGGVGKYEFYRLQLVLGAKDYARKCRGFRRAVVGCSGGIDSALTLALMVDALGAENILAITMPSEWSCESSWGDSEVLCASLGVKLLVHPIGEIVNVHRAAYKKATGQDLDGIALENLQARIRADILMSYSNKEGHLVVTTGNKSELAVGFFTLGGDSVGGLNLLGDIYKTEVFGLSRWINTRAGREVIARSIIEKPPSADLAPGQKDSDRLPDYETVLDPILMSLLEGEYLVGEERDGVEATVGRLMGTAEGRAVVLEVKRMVSRNEYKRRPLPPAIRVRARGFNGSRQVPIAAVHY
ncbi:NAD+ synthase [Ottowia sp.]|uniref:NAD+ synthase n=1 Tax=Ottowia sp. TaxID=1898956 RepID=UPI0025D4CB52|nr:NAD+ synthase [Ottowia sp.]MBK6616424.1 NAD+ synthase [Ottowia sp.]